MSKNWYERIQMRVITEMTELCGDVCDEDNLKLMSLHAAARRISGEDGFYPERASEMALIKISWRTVLRWYNLWVDYKMLPCKIPRIWCVDSTRNSRAWTSREVRLLKSVVDASPLLYLDELAKAMTLKLGRKIRGSTISYVLRKRLGYTRKKLFTKASQYVEKEKNDFIETLRFFLQKPEMAIFIDESHKDRSASRRKYGWSKKGTPVNYTSMFNTDRRYTLVGVADCFGFLLDACETVQHNVMEREEEKPLDADKFVEIFERSICPVLGNYSLGEAHSVVVLDNCSIHMDPRVKALAETRGAIIVYSAPYCPQVIPIEYMFHQWKDFLRRHSYDFDRDWSTIHQKALASVTPQQGLNYFKKTTLVELVENHPLLQKNEDEMIIVSAVLLVLDELDVL